MTKQELLEEGIVRYGTPTYLFHGDEAERTVQSFRNVLGSRADLCYAMKANPFLTEEMGVLTDRVEVCSMGEYRICREIQLDPGKILVSGVMKEGKDISEILNIYRGNCRYTAESVRQLQHFADWSNENRERISLFLRLTSGNQFGMDKEIIQNIIKLKDAYPYLDILGIHYFSGTRKKSADKSAEELKYLDAVLCGIKEDTGFQIRELEYGPGLSVPYFTDQQNTQDKDLKKLADAMDKMKWKGKITLEIGRALSASCGFYLTAVKDIKQNHGINYCIVDGGIHHLNYDGQIRGIYQPFFSVYPAGESAKAEHEWTVCGALCTVNDVLMQKVRIGNLQEGDIFIFENAGAYSMTEGMALFLSHPLPAAALYSEKNGWQTLRERQSTYQWNMGKRR